MESGGFHNIDVLPLGKLLQVKYVGKRPPKSGAGLVKKLLAKGFSSDKPVTKR